MPTAALRTKRQHFYTLAAHQVLTILEMQDKIVKDPNLLASQNLEGGVLELIEYIFYSRREVLAVGWKRGVEIPWELETVSSMNLVLQKTALIEGYKCTMHTFMELLLKLRLWILHPAEPFPLEELETNFLKVFCTAVQEVENAAATS